MVLQQALWSNLQNAWHQIHQSPACDEQLIHHTSSEQHPVMVPTKKKFILTHFQQQTSSTFFFFSSFIAALSASLCLFNNLLRSADVAVSAIDCLLFVGEGV